MCYNRIQIVLVFLILVVLCTFHTINIVFAEGTILMGIQIKPDLDYGLERACLDEGVECLLVTFRHMDDFLADVDAVVAINFLDFVNGNDIGTVYAQESVRR